VLSRSAAARRSIDMTRTPSSHRSKRAGRMTRRTGTAPCGRHRRRREATQRAYAAVRESWSAA
jgi:hypothetical protein